MELVYRLKSKTNYTPASYTANEVASIMTVHPGDVVGLVVVRTRVVFNGGGTDAILELGDTGDADRFVRNGDVDETTAGLYHALGGSGSVYTAIGRHLYTAATTIDVTFTANTSGTRTTGAFDFYVWVARSIQ